MKYSAKGIAPDCLSEFIRRKAGAQLRYNYFRGTRCKKEVHDALLKEQFFLCAYCGRRVKRDSESSLRSHIEHFDPANDKELDYSNMLACCGPGNNTTPRICGEAKDYHIIDNKLQPRLLELKGIFLLERMALLLAPIRLPKKP